MPQSIIGYIESLFDPAGPWSLDDLRVVDDDPEADDLGDGIQASGLVPYTLVPGLDCFDGYTGLTSQLRNTFDLRVGDVASEGPPANYFEFPYDWRRDNRASARRLKRLVDRELPKWRKFRDYPDAKLILIGHSMGGLLARYYVECLEGFKDTRAIITFGTPHRGSVKTIDYLVNGYRSLGLRLATFTELMRSFRSVYQLLPIYECVLENGQSANPVWRRVAEITLPKVNQTWAQEALDFYRKIEKGHEANKNLDEYDVRLLPVIGWGHTTLQSAKNLGHSVEVGTELPPAVDKVLTDGDGTVPRVSAIPIELHHKTEQWWPWNQKHATIQNNETLLGNTTQILSVLQGRLGQPARGPGATPEPNKIDLNLEDAYLSSEPVLIRVTATTRPEPRAVMAEIAPLAKGGQIRTISLKSEGNVWTCAELFAAGAYRVKVRLEGVNIEPVTDVFEVA